jgi:hypothetical protein
MVFFLALLPRQSVDDFGGWANEHLAAQREPVRRRLRPVLDGLVLAGSGASLDTDAARHAGVRRYLGWSADRHWMLDDARTG